MTQEETDYRWTQPASVEWPTLVLIVASYTGFFATTYWNEALSLVLAVPTLAIVIALHSSLQHEVLHGHPFASRRLSASTVFVAIGLFIPYGRFRQTHLKHHCDPHLTDPYDDPETNFLDPMVWQRRSPLARCILSVNNTLLGRMVLGPAISLCRFYREDLSLIVAGNTAVSRAWMLHAAGLVPVVTWLASYAAMPFWAYAVAAYMGLSLLKIRTFLEHRAHEHCAGRSVIVEDRGPLSFLFLNNNLHAVHHRFPNVPWYRLPALYRSKKQEFLRRNGGYRYSSYAEVFSRYLFAMKDPVAHPLMAQPEEPVIERARPARHLPTTVEPARQTLRA